MKIGKNLNFFSIFLVQELSWDFQICVSQVFFVKYSYLILNPSYFIVENFEMSVTFIHL